LKKKNTYFLLSQIESKKFFEKIISGNRFRTLKTIDGEFLYFKTKTKTNKVKKRRWKRKRIQLKNFFQNNRFIWCQKVENTWLYRLSSSKTTSL